MLAKEKEKQTTFCIVVLFVYMCREITGNRVIALALHFTRGGKLWELLAVR